jgi:hypothetical protein
MYSESILATEQVSNTMLYFDKVEKALKTKLKDSYMISKLSPSKIEKEIIWVLDIIYKELGIVIKEYLNQSIITIPVLMSSIRLYISKKRYKHAIKLLILNSSKHLNPASKNGKLSLINNHENSSEKKKFQLDTFCGIKKASLITIKNIENYRIEIFKSQNIKKQKLYPYSRQKLNTSNNLK